LHATKNNRPVILVSSVHHSKTQDEAIKKLEIVSYHKLIKDDVDTLDEKCAN